jgi:hypothetical protein
LAEYWSLHADYPVPAEADDDEALWVPDWDDEEAPQAFKDQLQKAIMSEQASKK